MDHHEYRFTIDAFKPDTLPMKRFAEYVRDLAKLLGSESEVHFDRVEAGSVEAVILVDGPAQRIVSRRLVAVSQGLGDADALSAFKDIDKRLASDNAVGILKDAVGNNVVEFRGRDRPQPLEYPAFNEPATLEGTLVSLSGTDDTKHAQLHDGVRTITKIQSKDLELLRRLSGYIWGPPVRLIGRGRFQRTADGIWEMKVFYIHDFEPLVSISFGETVARLRSVPNGIVVTPKLLEDLQRERSDENE